MKNAAFFTFLAVSIALSIWALSSIWFLDCRIKQNNDLIRETRKAYNEQNRDSLNDEIIKLKFEKTSYTEILDAQSNITIGYVTLLFTLFGITGLVISNRLAKEIKVDYQEEKSKIQGQFRAYRVSQERKYLIHIEENKGYYKKYDEDLKNFMSENNSLKIMLFINIANYNSLMAFQVKESGDEFNSFRFFIDSAKYLKMANDMDNSLQNSNNITHKLMEAYEIIEGLQNPNTELAKYIIRKSSSLLNDLFIILQMEDQLVRTHTGLIIAIISRLQEQHNLKTGNKDEEINF